MYPTPFSSHFRTPRHWLPQRRLRLVLLAIVVCAVAGLLVIGGVVLRSMMENGEQGEDSPSFHSLFSSSSSFTRGVDNGPPKVQQHPKPILDDKRNMASISSRSSSSSSNKPIAGGRIGHGGSVHAPRLLSITVQTAPTPGWCRMLLSHFLSNSRTTLAEQANEDRALTTAVGETEEDHSGDTTTTSSSSNSHHVNAPLCKGSTGDGDGGYNNAPVVYNIGWGEAYAHRKRPEWILAFIASAMSGGNGGTSTRQRGRSGACQSPVDQAPLRDDDILMFADGGDTLYSGIGADATAAAFAARTFPSAKQAAAWAVRKSSSLMEASPKDASLRQPLPPRMLLPALLFNAEANCYHQQTFAGSWGPKKARCLAAYRRFYAAAGAGAKNTSEQNIGEPEANGRRPLSKFRYLNAGAWIGRVWAVRMIFEEVKRRIDANKGLWCDQSVVGGLLLEGRFDPVTTFGIDTDNNFFLPIYHLNAQTDFCPSSSSGDGDAESSQREEEVTTTTLTFPRQLRLCHSGGIPAVLHFNGKSEKTASQLTHRTGWWQHFSSLKADNLSALKKAVRSEELFDSDAKATSAAFFLQEGKTWLGEKQGVGSVKTVCQNIRFPS